MAVAWLPELEASPESSWTITKELASTMVAKVSIGLAMEEVSWPLEEQVV